MKKSKDKQLHEERYPTIERRRFSYSAYIPERRLAQSIKDSTKSFK